MNVAFVVTGYSHFPGCPENPTESLVARLEQELAQRTLYLSAWLESSARARTAFDLRNLVYWLLLLQHSAYVTHLDSLQQRSSTDEKCPIVLATHLCAQAG